MGSTPLRRSSSRAATALILATILAIALPARAPAEDPAGAEGWRSVYRMRKLRAEAPVEEGFQKGNILASYAHLHLASRPRALERFIQSCTGKTSDAK